MNIDEINPFENLPKGKWFSGWIWDSDHKKFLPKYQENGNLNVGKISINNNVPAKSILPVPSGGQNNSYYGYDNGYYDDEYRGNNINSDLNHKKKKNPEINDGKMEVITINSDNKIINRTSYDDPRRFNLDPDINKSKLPWDLDFDLSGTNKDIFNISKVTKDIEFNLDGIKKVDKKVDKKGESKLIKKDEFIPFINEDDMKNSKCYNIECKLYHFEDATKFWKKVDVNDIIFERRLDGKVKLMHYDKHINMFFREKTNHFVSSKDIICELFPKCENIKALKINETLELNIKYECLLKLFEWIYFSKVKIYNLYEFLRETKTFTLNTNISTEILRTIHNSIILELNEYNQLGENSISNLFDEYVLAYDNEMVELQNHIISWILEFGYQTFYITIGWCNLEYKYIAKLLTYPELFDNSREKVIYGLENWANHNEKRKAIVLNLMKIVTMNLYK
jgi:hypothetical protein